MRSGFYQKILGEAFRISKRKEMRKMFLIGSFLVVALMDVNAQAPYKFTFQGVARNAAGKVFPNSFASFQLQILSGTPDGPLVVQDNITSPTNANGVFTLIIGSKTNILTLVDWSTGPYFLKVLMVDPETLQYVDLGSTQLLSVPYAVYANQAEKFVDNVPIAQKGTLGSGPQLTATGAGTRQIWYPRKGAFRAGTVSGDQWDDVQIGVNSFAAGLDVFASGAQAIALGNGTVSKSVGGFATGSFNSKNDNPNGGDFDRIFQLGNGSSDAQRSNAVTILRSGRVGIGNFAIVPDYLLDIAGRVRIQHRQNESAGIHLNTSTNALGSFVGMKTDDQVGFFIGGNWRFWVNAQGNGFLNGSIIQTSDRRLKRDFSALSNSLTNLANLSGKHYFWKDTTKSQQLQTGLIAQEVEQYFPELVTTDEKGYKAVNYIGLIPHLIESVKSLKAQTELIGSLKTEMQELRAELNNIKTAASNHSNQFSK